MATAKNTNIIDFNVGQVGQDANQWSAWDAAAGGTMLIRRALANNPDALVNNQFYRVAAEALTIRQPRGNQGFSEAMAERAVRGDISGGLYIQLEQSSDNAALTNRIHVPQADWDGCSGSLDRQGGAVIGRWRVRELTHG